MSQTTMAFERTGPRTRSTSLGVYSLTGCLLVGSLLALTMPARLVNR